MALTAGRRVWVECEVKPGPFSNERMVRIVGPSGEWFGFVGDFLLREQIERGKTAVQGIVDEVTNGRVSLFLPGASITGGVFEQDASQVMPFGALKA
jgi:hypothetical protein